MAIQLDVLTNSGVDLSYHRIEAVVLDNANNEVRALVGIFKDKETRQAGKPKVISAAIRLGDAGLLVNSTEGNVLKRAYALLKALPEYTGAVDV